MPACRVPYGGGEYEHTGRYDLLRKFLLFHYPLIHDPRNYLTLLNLISSWPYKAFTQDMELIPASGGVLPPGRRPVEGGYENGIKLYHAVGQIDGVRVPGKCGEHLVRSKPNKP